MLDGIAGANGDQPMHQLERQRFIGEPGLQTEAMGVSTRNSPVAVAGRSVPAAPAIEPAEDMARAASDFLMQLVIN